MEFNSKNIIIEIKIKLESIDSCLDDMEGDSYFVNNAKITENLKEIKKMFDFAIKNYPHESVEKIRKEIKETTKLIDKKFDNIVKKKNIELQELRKEINSLQNQKKIVNYR